MTFRDSELQRVYQFNFDCLQDPDEQQRQICGLLAVYDWFRLIEGQESPRVQEARELLLSAEMRPALRKWYRRCGADMNDAAIELREKLSALAGENFA